MEERINFTHLHVHSEYSLLDGSAKIGELVSRAKELGMDSIAITDHGVMFGVIDFYKAARAAGIKPILGCEVYVSSGSRFNRESNADNFYYHLVLLAENSEGYHNLIKLVSAGFTEGFYYKPRIDIELLRKYHKGIIALSACLAGVVAKNLLNVSYDRALKEALAYDEIFGQGNFFLELQDHGLADQKTVNEALIRMSGETGIPLVCTNDIHYIYNTDAKAHEVLLCIQTGKTMLDVDRMVYEGEQFYLKSAEEMAQLFAHVPEAVSNSYEIAKRCDVEIKFHEYKLPSFEPPDGKAAFEYLKELCYDGLRARYGEITPEIADRLLYELSVIDKMGFSDYFLITWDFIKYATDNGIAVGPGRGSAAGCIVAYSLRITNIDPLKYNLLFERFLNSERVSMPDIDIDFCYERRQEVIDYVVKKYGADRVAQIITFGTMAARGAIRDVGRALAVPYAEVDKIAKMIPFAIGMTIKDALEMNADLRNEYRDNEDTKYLIDMAMRLEGLPRHASTHAAGVVITNEPVDCYVPLNQNDGAITTQFPMNTLEELGLLKMDFLGLRTLTVIQKTVDEIKRNYGIDIDIDNLDTHDEGVYEMISQAKTEGIFQLESAGMKSFMKELQPSCIEDLIAGISLYRPGPMDFIPKYIMGKNNRDKIKYTHQSLEPILKPTYGCIVYQEQVMQIVRDLAGYSLARSDLMRRAMSKKKADVMAKERHNFIYGLPESGTEKAVAGCLKNGIPIEAAEKIFDEMTGFAQYAFNKSHAAAYAVIGYQTAWLKLHYPVEFMAALMTSVMDSSSKIAEYINECRKMGITVAPPDVNEGFGHFSVSNGVIRFGLNAIKNVGRPTVAAIVAERKSGGEFKSLTEFVNRMSTSDINKRCVESLIKAGAFDCLGGFRSQYTAVFEPVLNSVAQVRKRNIEGQMSLFEMTAGEEAEAYQDALPKMPEYDANRLLADEKEVLGIYVSGHPVSEYEEEMKKYITAHSIDFIAKIDDNSNMDNLGNNSGGADVYDGASVAIGGIIAGKSVKYTKNNDAMAFLTVEDLYGSVEVVVFPKVYEKYSKQIVDGQAVVVFGRAQLREEKDATVICNDIKFLQKKDGAERNGPALWLKIPKDKAVPYDKLMSVLSRFRGATPVVIYDEKTEQRMRAKEGFWVNVDNDYLMPELKNLLGEKSVVVK